MAKKGFTLIELSAVAAIVSALSVGTYHAVQKGKSSQCLNNLKQLYQAVSMFSMDNSAVPSASFFPSSVSDPRGIHNILAQYGARGSIPFCPSIPEQLNIYGTNYIWNDSLNGKSIDSLPPGTWLMTEMTAVSQNIPAPHTGQGYNILYAGGNAQPGPRVSFPSVPESRSEDPGKPQAQEEPRPKQSYPYLLVSAPLEIQAGEKAKFIVSIKDPSGKSFPIGETILEISSGSESAEFPSSLKVTGNKESADFESLFYKAGKTTLKVTDSRTNLTSSVDIQVAPGRPHSVEFTGFPVTWEAGKPGRVTAACYDKWKNRSGYTGPFFIYDDNMDIPPLASEMKNGQWAQDLVFTRAIEKNVLHAAIESLTVSGPGFAVLHSAPEILHVSGEDETVAGTPCQVYVEIRDMFGNTCTGYTGQAEMEIPEGASSDSSRFSCSPEDRGRKKTGVTFFSAGNKSLRISSGQMKNEKGIYVNPGPLSEYRIRDIGPQEAGTPFDIVVRATDRWGNQIKGFSLRDSSGSIRYVNRDSTAGLWMETAVITRAGNHSIYIEDAFGIKGRSNSFEVKASSPEKMEIDGMPRVLKEKEQYSARVTFRDSYGNEIRNYAGELAIDASGGLKAALKTDGQAVISIETLSSGMQTLRVSDRRTGLKSERILFVQKGQPE